MQFKIKLKLFILTSLVLKYIMQKCYKYKRMISVWEKLNTYYTNS